LNLQPCRKSFINVFVTGAAGFIGGSIAAALVRAGPQVTHLVRNASALRELESIGVAGVVGTRVRMRPGWQPDCPAVPDWIADGMLAPGR
jgi:nucleoside-diphosphate-sugar epimerase